jgi:hypothetical protein
MGVEHESLTPINGTDTLGRSGFYIHGDNSAQDSSASNGCIILNNATRTAIDQSGIGTLTVVH